MSDMSKKKRSNNANCFPHEMTFELDAALLQIKETSYPFNESTENSNLTFKQQFLN